MDISVSTVLTKMAEQLQKARATQDMQHIREHIAAIRVLCDVILEGENQTAQHPVPSSLQPLVLETRTERIDIGEDANGPSLFDF
ncbi:YwdI family protein [Anoxybacteroides tepidamans]|uniref:YwdI family protein n=1 Tax=Anoxybacteroides tepidamans TaxID=265948 RepID=UPI0004827EF6|nr:YwdI family protein [Anoxybacillus tepidamans]